MLTLWKSLIQPRLDYCSQLWCPADQTSINLLEGIQHSFFSKVAGMENLSHWERIKKLCVYSQERRRERYMVLFLWNISEGLVKGYDVAFTECGRRGRMAEVKPHVNSAPAAVKNQGNPPWE